MSRPGSWYIIVKETRDTQTDIYLAIVKEKPIESALKQQGVVEDVSNSKSLNVGDKRDSFIV